MDRVTSQEKTLKLKLGNEGVTVSGEERKSLDREA